MIISYLSSFVKKSSIQRKSLQRDANFINLAEIREKQLASYE